MEDEKEEVEVGGARPRRMSEVTTVKHMKPIPKASSLFILSYQNPFRYTP